MHVGWARNMATVCVLMFTFSMLILLYRCNSEPCNKNASESKDYEIKFGSINIFHLVDYVDKAEHVKMLYRNG